MISGKELTLEETLKEMNKLKFRLIDLNSKLKIGFLEIKAITYKDIVSKSNYKGDVMLNNMIRLDDTKDDYDATLESYNGYRELAIEKISDMLEKESIGYCISYFRDTMHWKWKQICKLFGYSRSQVNKIYKKYKDETL